MKTKNTTTIAILAINLSQNSPLKNKESTAYTTTKSTTTAIIPRTFRLSITIHQIILILILLFEFCVKLKVKILEFELKRDQYPKIKLCLNNR